MSKSKPAVAMEDSKKKGFDDWEKENFARDLMRAEEIKSDPKKMKAAQEHLMKMHNSMKKAMNMEQLKEHASNLDHEDMGMTASMDSETKLEGPKHEKKKGDKKEDKKEGEKIS